MLARPTHDRTFSNQAFAIRAAQPTEGIVALRLVTERRTAVSGMAVVVVAHPREQRIGVPAAELAGAAVVIASVIVAFLNLGVRAVQMLSEDQAEG